MAGGMGGGHDFQQAGEKIARLEVAAGLPRHMSCVFNDRGRGKPAATSFFISAKHPKGEKFDADSRKSSV